MFFNLEELWGLNRAAKIRKEPDLNDFYIKWKLLLQNDKMAPGVKNHPNTMIRFYFTLSTYSPVLVLTRMSSPSFTNKGTFTVAPVSTLAGFNVLVAVSPFTPGSL